jgi:hypothetical protein
LKRALKTFPPRLVQDAAIEVAAGAKERSERAMVMKTTKITIETESHLVVHKTRTVVTWCPACYAEVETMTLTADGLGDGIPAALLEGWLRTGMLHLWRHAEGSDQVCLPSLLRCFQAESVPKLGTTKTEHKTGDEQ